MARHIFFQIRFYYGNLRAVYHLHAFSVFYNTCGAGTFKNGLFYLVSVVYGTSEPCSAAVDVYNVFLSAETFDY